MKKVISLIVISLFVMVNGVCKTNMSFISVTSAKTTEDSKIDLSGNFLTTGTRSIFEPIILIQYSTHLEATFYTDLGTIVIEVRDKENNIIFQDFINTNIQKQYQMLIPNHDEKNLYIEFRNSQGQYMCGNFNG